MAEHHLRKAAADAPPALRHKRRFAILGGTCLSESVEGIEVIETEWGSPLHQRLVEEEHAARVAWRDSPEAREQARRMSEAGPLEWGRVIYPVKRKKTPIYKW